MKQRRHRSGFLLATAALTTLVSCQDVAVTAVDPAQINLSPQTTTVAVSTTARLTATVLSSEGQALSGRSVQWTSQSTSVATVDNAGVVRGVNPGTVTIQAVSGSASGTAIVTVTPAPAIAFSVPDVTINAIQNGTTPGDRNIVVSNSGGGDLAGLSAAIRYPANGASGWLTATLAGTSAPTILVLSASQAGLATGTHSAMVDLSAPGSSASLLVRLVVAVPPRVIGLTSNVVSFSARVGGANPPDQTVGITNAGGGSLTGLGYTVVFPAGATTGWLTPSLSGTTAPATLTLHAATGALPVGVYSATVRVASPVAQNSPQSIAVTAVVGGQDPTIHVTPTLVTLNALRAATTPVSQTVQVNNIGASALTDLATTVSYSGGQPTGWLTAQLSSTTGPATLTLNAAPGALQNGTYTATVAVTSPVATNNPQIVNVSFNVLEPPPGVPATLTATTVSTSQIDLSWAAATGSVTRYRIQRRTGANGTFALIDSVAPPQTTYQNNTGLAPAVQYGYRVQACNPTGCSAFSPVAQSPTLPTPPGGVSATTASSTQINLSWNAVSGAVANYRIERSRTSSTGFTQVGTVQSTNATVFQNTGLNPGTQFFYRVRACNPGGCSAPSTEVSATTLPGG